MASASSPTDRRWKLAAAGLLAIHAMLAWRLRAPGVSTGHDDAIYLLLGRDLLHGSYRNFWLVDAPRHGLYPPGYPALLAVTGSSGEHGFAIGVLLNLLLSVGWLGLFTAILWPWSRRVAIFSLAVMVTNPMIVEFAGQVRSEPLFGVLTLATIIASTRSGPRAATSAGAFAIAAALTRIVGVSVIAGLLGSWLLDGRWRRATVLVIASGLAVGSWIAWSATAPGRLPGESYWGDAAHDHVPSPDWPRPEPRSPAVLAPAPSALPTPVPSAEPTAPRAPEVAPAPGGPPGSGRPLGGSALSVAKRLLQRTWYNAREYVGALADLFSVPGIPGTKVDDVVGLGLALGLGLVGVVAWWRRLRIGILIGVIYLGIIVVWPYQVSRFLLPLLPLIGGMVVFGAERLAAGARPALAAAVPAAVAGLLTLGQLAGLDRMLRAERGCDRAAPSDSACFPPASRGYFQGASLADRRTPSEAIFLAPKPATLYYLTGRRSVNELQAAALDSPDLGKFLDRNRVGYILLSRVHFDQLVIAARLQAFCAQWAGLGSFDDGGTILLGRRPDDRAVGEDPPDGCTAVRAWRIRSE